MPLYTTSSKEIHDKYHKSENVITKRVYRDILRNRAERGSSEARKYLMMIEGKLKF